LGRELSRQPIRVRKGPNEVMVNSVALLPTGVYLVRVIADDRSGANETWLFRVMVQ
ncbi:MAG: hypothetical protein H7Z75_02160, partial [Ferruginibacter sp.]|nr:hypothetical protein [Cytophagales bacterium]